MYSMMELTNLDDSSWKGIHFFELKYFVCKLDMCVTKITLNLKFRCAKGICDVQYSIIEWCFYIYATFETYCNIS